MVSIADDRAPLRLHLACRSAAAVALVLLPAACVVAAQHAGGAARLWEVRALAGLLSGLLIARALAAPVCGWGWQLSGLLSGLLLQAAAPAAQALQAAGWPGAAVLVVFALSAAVTGALAERLLPRNN